MGPEETLDGLILLSVEHNLKLMHMLSNEQKFGNIIEGARSTKSWQQLRAYLNVFEEYFTYLSVRQKAQALSFLYELLMHREGDIRRQAGALIGQIIARFHLVYRKEVPADAQNDPAEEVPFTLWGQYLDMIIFPDHKTTPQQRSHISYTLKLVVESMLNHARPGDIPRFLDALLGYYNDPAHTDDDTAFTLLDAARYLPPKHYGEEIREKLVNFAAHFAASEDLRLVTAALQFLRETVRNIPRSHPQMARIADLVEAVPSPQLTTVFLKCRILRRAGRDVSALEHTLYHTDITSEVFLDNLKTATPWIIKEVNIRLLAAFAAFLIMGEAVRFLPHSLALACAVGAAGPPLILRLMPPMPEDQPSNRPRRAWLLPVQMALGGLAVWALTTASAALGAAWSGLLMVFPVMRSPLFTVAAIHAISAGVLTLYVLFSRTGMS